MKAKYLKELLSGVPDDADIKMYYKKFDEVVVTRDIHDTEYKPHDRTLYLIDTTKIDAR